MSAKHERDESREKKMSNDKKTNNILTGEEKRDKKVIDCAHISLKN